MRTNHSKILEDVLRVAQQNLGRSGSGHTLSVDHLFLALLKENKGHAVTILRKLLSEEEIEFARLKIEQILGQKPVLIGGNPTMEKRLYDLSMLRIENTLRSMYVEMLDSGQTTIHTGHFLLTILKDNRHVATQVLNQFYGITYDKVKPLVALLPQDEDGYTPGDEENEIEMYSEGDEEAGEQESFDTPTTAPRPGKKGTPSMLEKFGTDLTRAATEGKLDPVIGRADEISRLIQVLGRRKKNNPILIGEAGVGKSAIVEGLALRIAQRDVPYALLNKRIYTLDVASLVAGTKYRGQFEERMKTLLKELSGRNDIVLFIDEIHTIVGAGSTQGSLDTANILKPALARGDLQCIGATTLDEYRQSIESDGALERRFQKIMVEPTTKADTLAILRNIKKHYEDYHFVTYTDEAIEASVELTDRYVTDRYFPDKAIDVLDEAGAKAHIFQVNAPEPLLAADRELEQVQVDKKTAVAQQDFEQAATLRNREIELKQSIEALRRQWEEEVGTSRVEIGREQIEAIVASMTGVPVEKISMNEKARLKGMAEYLSRVVIGQPAAVEKVTKAIHRSRAGLKDPKRPIGTFLFVGPTGVGKTHLAKELAKFMFDRDDALIRIDMSEYSEKYNVSRLIGSPPGYVGYGEGGQLTEQVRRHPYSVILFDEIEKAHPDVFNIMLQIFDDGHLTDGQGRKVDFRNTILIMTSNVGSRAASENTNGLGFNTVTRVENEQTRPDLIYRKALSKLFAPEFINRIDDIVVFNTLATADIRRIVDLEFSHFAARAHALGYTVTLTATAKDFLVEAGYEPKYGVRSLRRAMLEHVEEPFAELIVGGQVAPGDRITATLNKDKDGLTLTAKPTQVETVNKAGE
ncbi:MAG: ATP-dependent Clp protease ATP-binding subunit [Rikenellaceae bacterium]|jgi:ATP-dependent Clp protease ATP-binding subunit ClpC|nr:ATP-dependent Clp protease ATP-binding subunit [Rikenellaceae bacterium]